MSKRVIHKWMLNEETKTFQMARSASVIDVATQGGHPCLWTIQEVDDEIVSRTFIVIPTGLVFNQYLGMSYVGTAHDVADAGLVFHVFEVL